MTTVTIDPQIEVVRLRDRGYLWSVVGLSLLVALIMSAPNLADPMIRHDDFPALLLQSEAFWPKTLDEGRWLNYVWHLRGIQTPAWLNFAVYQVFWAIFAAGIGVLAFPRNKVFALSCAGLIIACPPALAISFWFNTLVPGIGVLAFYAILAHFLSQNAHRALLPGFVVLGFWAYTTYPLMLLAVCILRTDKKSWADLLGLGALFVASFGLAILATYTVNWQMHGIFGVPLADWRDATPAHDWASLVGNLPVLAETFTKFATHFVKGAPWFCILPATMFVAASISLARHSLLEAAYLHLGFWMGMALIVLQVLKTGAFAPPRAFAFAWVFSIVIALRALQSAGKGSRRTTQIAAIAAMCMLVVPFKTYSLFHTWQGFTRQLAEDVAQAGARADGRVFVVGDTRWLPEAKSAHIQVAGALASRMEQLTGRKGVSCSSHPETCHAAGVAETLEGQTKAVEIHQLPEGTAIYILKPEK